MNLTIATLAVPGAHIYYQTRGSGPTLMLIAGGAGDASSFDGIAPVLADRYTVVTFDRRGFLRSPMDDPVQHVEIETHAEDVHHVLLALGNEPAYVFGSSIGALIGLALTVRYPDQVRLLVAHEPPLSQLLSEAERANARLLELYRREGGAAAISKFAESIGVHPAGAAALARTQRDSRMAEHNVESFLKRDASAVGRYRLDVDALKTIRGRVVIAGGSGGRQYFPYRAAAKLAEQIGTPLVEFPGNHAGYTSEPAAFAAKLASILEASRGEVASPR